MQSFHGEVSLNYFLLWLCFRKRNKTLLKQKLCIIPSTGDFHIYNELFRQFKMFPRHSFQSTDIVLHYSLRLSCHKKQTTSVFFRLLTVSNIGTSYTLVLPILLHIGDLCIGHKYTCTLAGILIKLLARDIL